MRGWRQRLGKIGRHWAVALALLTACSHGAKKPPEPDSQDAASWSIVAADLDEALLSVGGSSQRDVWVVGADRGRGPAALHWDGQAWERRSTGTRGDLWWVHVFHDGTALFS